MSANNERRLGNRRRMDLPACRQDGDREVNSWTADLSPTGVRLRINAGRGATQPLCNIELHLVPGAVTTVLHARRVWQNADHEAFEFVSPSFSQQMILERMVGNL